MLGAAPQPGMPGMPQPGMNGPTAADLQEIAGQPAPVTLDQMAGVPPTAPGMGG
jgi:hypothetical protein